MDFDVAWLADFNATCYGSLEACAPANLYRSAYINRTNWRERYDKGAMGTPWYVFHTGAQSEADSTVTPSAGNAFWQPVTVFGVYASTDPNAQIGEGPLGNPIYDIVGWVQAQAHVLRNAFLAYPGDNFLIMPGKLPLIDVSDEMECNRIFLIQQVPFWGFKLACQLLVGTAYGNDS